MLRYHDCIFHVWRCAFIRYNALRRGAAPGANLVILAGAIYWGLPDEFKLAFSFFVSVAAIGHYHSILKIFVVNILEVSISNGWGWWTRNTWEKKQCFDCLQLYLIMKFGSFLLLRRNSNYCIVNVNITAVIFANRHTWFSIIAGTKLCVFLLLVNVISITMSLYNLHIYFSF